MLALRYQNKQLNVTDVPEPEAQGSEALIRVTLAGICNTDLEIIRGYAEFEGTPGHEFVGIVENAPDKNLIGKRVVGEINAGCGNCQLCKAGDARHCRGRTVLGIHKRDGAFAEFLTLPVENLLVVPDEVPDEYAVFTEPLAAAYAILERVHINDQSRVAVIGDGKLGLLCSQVIQHKKTPIVLIGKHPDKLSIVNKYGIETALVGDINWNKEFDVVVEASGSPSGFSLALNLLKPRGTLVLKSTFHGTTEINTAPIVVDEISIIGSRCGRFEPALNLLKENMVDVKSLINETYPLKQGVKAIKHASEKGSLKVLLRNE
jgi:threonine dehydrogenase-like Zn-dependent dehydrogenase